MVASPKKIIVTGGAGFIGSHLIDTLSEQGHKIVVIDNLIHGKKERIPKKVRLIVKDITDQNLEKEFLYFRPDIVYHLAAQQDVGFAQKNPTYDARINILGTLNILECSRLSRVKSIIYSDSVAGFGEPQKLPLTSTHPRFPISFYGISKHTVEHYLSAYSHYFGLRYVGLILANVYGPRQDPYGEGGVVAIFANKMKKKQKIIIHGSGKQTRDFIYVQDVVNAFISAMHKYTNELLMVGTGTETSINELFSQMSELSNYVKVPVFGPVRSGDVERSVFNTKATKKILGWKYSWNLKKGLQATIATF